MDRHLLIYNFIILSITFFIYAYSFYLSFRIDQRIYQNSVTYLASVSKRGYRIAERLMMFFIMLIITVLSISGLQRIIDNTSYASNAVGIYNTIVYHALLLKAIINLLKFKFSNFIFLEKIFKR